MVGVTLAADALPPDLQVPPYGRGTLADVLPGVAAALGVSPAGFDDSVGITAALAGARRIAVVLIDGMGAELLANHRHLAPNLSALSSPFGALSAPCPSTTPVSLTTLGTGVPPGTHGVLGFVTDVPGEDRTLHHNHWKDDPDPRVWQSHDTVFERAAAADVAVQVIGPWAFAGSGLTGAAYRGARYTGAFGPGDLTAVTIEAMAASSRSLTYMYYADLDTAGHVLDGLPDDGALVVTADHGMVDIPRNDRVDADTVPALSDGVRVLVGEPRARYVHAVPGAAGDVLANWRAVLGERAWTVSREEAIESGIFGHVDNSLAARIGDVVAMARGDLAVIASERERIPSMLAAYHGSLTSAELAIPLLIARGRALN
jgi:hypothetical protein